MSSLPSLVLRTRDSTPPVPALALGGHHRQRGVDDAVEPLSRLRFARVIGGVERGDHRRFGLRLEIKERPEARLVPRVPDEPHPAAPQYEERQSYGVARRLAVG